MIIIYLISILENISSLAYSWTTPAEIVGRQHGFMHLSFFADDFRELVMLALR
ncbi:MAG: hypothetical protein KKE79_04810 [Actinobacteria bacterium]|nr:hypothetical protein [Actinomycetota bacterium]MBU4385521.1 hypothetical protein [Actinomycetota bacterium]MBU4489938.1 hypothetical protein [Actinomycetota bacterium]MCG2794370.1 hypothetical protein [Actinomycetes bacterium]